MRISQVLTLILTIFSLFFYYCSKVSNVTKCKFTVDSWKIFTHKVKVSVLRNLPVVGEDILRLDVVARLLLPLVVVVVFLLLSCFVGVLLIKVVHEGGTYGLLWGRVSCGG